MIEDHIGKRRQQYRLKAEQDESDNEDGNYSKDMRIDKSDIDEYSGVNPGKGESSVNKDFGIYSKDPDQESNSKNQNGRLRNIRDTHRYKQDILRDDSPESWPQNRQQKIPRGTDVKTEGKLQYFHPLDDGISSSLPQKTPYRKERPRNFKDDFENPFMKKMYDFGEERTEENQPHKTELLKEFNMVQAAFADYFNLNEVPRPTKKGHIENQICHLGFAGVDRKVPIPYQTMATFFHDEDIDRAERVLGNKTRRYPTTEELFGPKHFDFEIQKYYDKEFEQDMVAIMGPSEKLMNWGRYFKVRAQMAQSQMSAEIPPVGLDVWQIENINDNPDNLRPIDDFKEGDIVDGYVRQIHMYAGITVDFGCYVQGLIPVPHANWSDAAFDWINGANPLKLHFTINMKITCRIYRIWRPDVVWRFPVQLEQLNPILDDFVTKPEQFVNPIQWGLVPENTTREIVEDHYGFPMETPSERYPEDQKIILKFNEWEPEWVKQRKFEQTEIGMLWGTNRGLDLPEFRKNIRKMKPKEYKEAADESLKKRAKHELNRPSRDEFSEKGQYERRIMEKMQRQMVEMKKTDFKTDFRP